MVGPRATIGEYLGDEDAAFALWQDILDVVFRDSPNEPRLERVGPTARTVFLVRWFAGNVNNAGLVGFLSNTSGAYAAETLDALRRVGAAVLAELLQRALSVFPGGVAPRDSGQRLQFLLSLGDSARALFNQLDRRYDRDVVLPGEGDGESLDALLAVHMHDRASEAVVA